MVTTKMVPPDGGYGWIIVAAFSLHHMLVIPTVQGFGLMFKDKFKELEFSATDISLIMNTNGACAAWFGLINGALLKKLGYRKVAVLGALLMTSGLFMMAFANTFTQFMIIYGVITAIGMGMGLSSYPLALNSYFTNNRSKAFGYAMTFAGFGSILIPQLISLLLRTYGAKGAVIVLSSIVAHSFVSSFLLQPVKHHMKEEIIEDDIEKIEDQPLLKKGTDEVKNNNSELPLEEEAQIESSYSLDTQLSGSVLSLCPTSRERSLSMSSRNQVKNPKGSTTQKSNTLLEENEMDGVKVLTEKENNNNINLKYKKVVDGNLSVEMGKRKTASSLIRFGNYMVNLFDLTLLKDLTFVNIIFGIAAGVFAEKNFAQLIPFIMQEYDLNTQEIATFMSMHSVADICFRFITPYVNKLFNQPVRVMYLWGLVLLILFRSSLLVTSNYVALLACAVLIGFARGLRTIYWILIVPSHVPIDRLASASGLQSITTGFFIWLGAPIIGFVKDLSGSFKMCLFVINFMSFLNIIMWSIEFTYKRIKSKDKTLDTEDVKS